MVEVAVPVVVGCQPVMQDLLAELAVVLGSGRRLPLAVAAELPAVPAEPEGRRELAPRVSCAAKVAAAAAVKRLLAHLAAREERAVFQVAAALAAAGRTTPALVSAATAALAAPGLSGSSQPSRPI